MSQRERNRAEAAEVRVQELLEIGTGLQLCIAAALVVCDERGAYGQVDIEDIRRALTPPH